MYTIGLNILHANSSASIFKNGELIGACEEERFTKIKNDCSFPKNAIEYCLINSKINISHVDYVTYNSNNLYNYFHKLKFFIKNIFNDSLLKISLKKKNKKKYIIDNFKSIYKHKFRASVVGVPHHLSHAYSTNFFLNKNLNSLIFSFDGSGDFSTSETYLINKKKIKLVDKSIFPHSLGFLYSAFTQFVGFLNYGDEYKLMGLSAFGKPIYLEKIKSLLQSENPFKLNLKYFNIPEIDYSLPSPQIKIIYNHNFINLFGQPNNLIKTDTDISQIYKDYAASIQKFLEDFVINYLERCKSNYDVNNLYLTGGCSLNGLLVGKIIYKKIFDKVFLDPAPSDCGGAIGSVAYFLNKKKINISLGKNYPYTGPSYTNEYIQKNVIKNIQNKNDYQIKLYNNFDELSLRAAQNINKKKIIFWFQDAIEWGPRALGNRSILACPTDPNIKNFINSHLKKRELFRPFASAILEEYANRYFEMENTNSPYMNIVYKVKNITKTLYPGIVHADNTSRVQTVNVRDNKKFYKLLNQFYKISNCPMILNTSLNKNTPIILQPETAFDLFLNTKVECIVLNDWLIEKKK